MRTRSLSIVVIIGVLLGGCAGFSAKPTPRPRGITTTPPAAAATPSTTTPSAEIQSTAPSPEPVAGPYLAAGRDPLGSPTGDDRLLLGRLNEGDYEVVVAKPNAEAEVLASIEAIAERIPAPWRLVVEWGRAAVSDTGFLALTVVQGPEGDENVGLAIFDLSAPGEPPVVVDLPAGGFRIAGDRLWVQTDEDAFAVYDLPATTPRVVKAGDGSVVKRGGRVPFYLDASGDAVLVERSDGDGLESRLLDLAGIERPFVDEALLVTTGRDLPFDRDGGELRDGHDCDGLLADPVAFCVVWPAGAVIGYMAGDAIFGPIWATAGMGATPIDLVPGSACEAAWARSVPSLDGQPGRQCVIWPAGAAVGFSTPGDLIDVAWDPSEQAPVWIATKGLGIIRDGAPQTIVRFGDWVPSSIAGFWSNTALLAAADDPHLARGVTGPDLITPLPMPPDSIGALPGDFLLRVVPGEGDDDSG